MCQKSSKSSNALGFKWNHNWNTWYGKKQAKNTRSKKVMEKFISKWGRNERDTYQLRMRQPYVPHSDVLWLGSYFGALLFHLWFPLHFVVICAPLANTKHRWRLGVLCNRQELYPPQCIWKYGSRLNFLSFKGGMVFFGSYLLVCLLISLIERATIPQCKYVSLSTILKTSLPN